MNSSGEDSDHRSFLASLSSRILSAHFRINSYLKETPLIYDERLKVWMKCENEQRTGSFKWRGALAKLSTLQSGSTIITASTGNHGLAVATAANLYQLTARIYVPVQSSPIKIEKIRREGAELIFVEGDSLTAEIMGKKFAEANQLPWVSPYNDIDVISGQGTIGNELDRQLSHIGRIYITVGGGGLVSGIAAWMKHHYPDVEIIGCQPVNSPEMYLSTLAGHVVTAPESKATWSDGSAGPLEEDSITFPLCQKLIDHFALISEEEIENAIRYMNHHHGKIIEGSAGVALAAAMKEENQQGQTSIAVLCGGNIDPDLHKNLCQA